MRNFLLFNPQIYSLLTYSKERGSLPYDTHNAPLTGERLMPNTWFTADFHLGHKNIIRYCNRPFDSVEAMNCAILERLNTAVRANDVLYFLGDFCIGPKARALELRREIRCKKIFAVPGNHDKDTRKLTQEFSCLIAIARCCAACSFSTALLIGPPQYHV